MLASYRISQLILELLTRTLFKVRVYGRKNVPRAPYIVIANHESHLDPPLIGMVCRKHFVHFLAKAELFDMRGVGAWMRSIGGLCVREGRSVGTLKNALNIIKKGEVIGIFPEGTRSVDGKLREAEQGVGFLIVKAQVPVLPIYIKGSGAALPKGGRAKKGTEIDVFVGSPIKPDLFLHGWDKAGKDYAAIADRAMTEIARIKEQGKNVETSGKTR